MQIGELAQRVGLSQRTVRHYEEVGLLAQAERSQGGFRLYSETAVQRMLVIKQMKPLGFTLEQMRDVLQIQERLAQPRVSAGTRKALQRELEVYLLLVDEQIVVLHEQVTRAQAFAAELRNQTAPTSLRRHRSGRAGTADCPPSRD